MWTPNNQDIFLIPKDVCTIEFHCTPLLLTVSSVSCTLAVVLPVYCGVECEYSIMWLHLRTNPAIFTITMILFAMEFNFETIYSTD